MLLPTLAAIAAASGLFEFLLSLQQHRTVEIPPLSPGTTRDLILPPGVEHAFSIEGVPAGYAVRLVLEQLDLDLVSRLEDAHGRVLLTVDFPNGRGNEWIHWNSPEEGEYTLHVRRYANEDVGRQTGGRYRLSYLPLLAVGPSEQRRAEALQLFLQGYALLPEGPQSSLPLYSRATETLEAEASLPPEYALFWRELVRVQLNLGMNKEAAKSCERALQRLEPLTTHPESSSLLYQCGLAAFNLGDGRRAAELFQRSLGIAEDLDEPMARVKALNGLGRQLRRESRYGPALDRHEAALKICGEALDPSPILRAETLMFIGDLQLQMGRPGEAAGNLRTALGLQQELGSDTLYAELTLARAQAVLGETDRALESLRDAEASLRASGQLHRLHEVFHARGLVAREHGRRLANGHRQSEAEAAYRLALGSFEQALAAPSAPPEPRRLYNNWASIGWLRVDLGDLRAEQAFRRALPLAQDSGDTYAEAHIQAGWAAASYQKNELEDALDRLEAALQIIEGLRQRAPSVELRTSFFATWQDYYELHLEIAAELFFRTRDSRYLTAGFSRSEQGRARTLRDLIGSSFLAEDLSAPLKTRLRAIQDRITHLSFERLLAKGSDPGTRVGVSDPKGSPRSSTHPTPTEALLQELDSLDQELATESSTSAAPTPSPLQLFDIGTPSVAAQQRSLDKSSLLLSYAFGRHRAFLFAIDRDDLRIFDLGERASLENTARRVWKLHAEGGRRAMVEHRQAVEELSRRLLGPVAHRLKQRLIIVPSGSLHTVPFAALPLPTTSGTPPTDSYLVEAHQILQLPAASLLSLLESPAPPATDSALILGPPSLPRNLRLTDLPAARREVDTIRDVFLDHGQEPLLLLGAEANRETFLASRPDRYRVVHIASHSYPMASYPELSAIVLSNHDESGRPVSPYLTPGDFFRLELRADLVVLSACDTALGDLVPGEGMLGFPYALFSAGAAQVLVSLWRVDDEATAELMAHFYRAYLTEALPPAAALRRAQLALLEHPSDERWRAPYYWSAFVLLGVPSPSPRSF